MLFVLLQFLLGTARLRQRRPQGLQNVRERSRGSKCELHEVGPCQQWQPRRRCRKNVAGPLPQRQDQRTAKAYPSRPERLLEAEQPCCQNWQRNVVSRAGDLDRAADSDVISGVYPLAGEVKEGGLPE